MFDPAAWRKRETRTNALEPLQFCSLSVHNDLEEQRVLMIEPTQAAVIRPAYHVPNRWQAKSISVEMVALAGKQIGSSQTLVQPWSSGRRQQYSDRAFTKPSAFRIYLLL